MTARARKALIGDAYMAGENTTQIAARFGISRQRVEEIARTLGLPKRNPARGLRRHGDPSKRQLASEAELPATMSEGSDSLRVAIEAEAAAWGERRRQAQSIQTVGKVLDLQRPQRELAQPATRPFEWRPIAASREPCTYCGIRGDIGCDHQRALEAAERGSCGQSGNYGDY